VTEVDHERTEPSRVVIVRNGKERPGWDLNRGDRIAWRDYDPSRQCYIFHVVTELPPSREVADWDIAA
jgi:hypothetical protein